MQLPDQRLLGAKQTQSAEFSAFSRCQRPPGAAIIAPFQRKRCILVRSERCSGEERWGAMQCNVAKWVQARELQRGGCEFRGLALMGMDLSEVTLMWYDRPCPGATLQCSSCGSMMCYTATSSLALPCQGKNMGSQLTRPTMLPFRQESI